MSRHAKPLAMAAVMIREPGRRRVAYGDGLRQPVGYAL